ncbi:MAG TPA: hypothetical protein VFQ68_26265 [Streptosporangiaceae bacterium]|nr:hypothetical protein [Streptosporangiaceae bacterium]
MTETTNDVPTAQVTFAEYHRPGLKPGRYTIEMSQQVTVPDTTEEFSVRRQFTVSGDRFSLYAGDVFAVFPPDGSLGDHSTVLPHVMLERSTLPWEFTAHKAGPPAKDKAGAPAADEAGAPWLALLLFGEQETLGGTLTRPAFLREYQGADGPVVWDHLLEARTGWLRPLPRTPDGALIVARAARAAAELGDAFTADTAAVEAVLDRYRSPQVVTVADLRDATAGPVHWPGLGGDLGDHQDTDRVTVIDVDKRLLATLLPSEQDLSLLAHVRQTPGPSGQPATELAVVLGNRLPQPNGISVVHLVSVEGRYADGEFDLAGVADLDYVRLVSLKSWQFACVDPFGDFTGLLGALDRTPSTLRLPPRPDPEAERHLKAGLVPLAHRTRQSGTTVSWYRGPLIPCPSPGEIPLPAPTAESLVRYDSALGLFDVSYAAAWELGRLLAVHSAPLAASLYSWKRAHAQAVAQGQAWILHPGWAAPGQDTDQLPADVVAWFDDLRRLRGVPFGYLVPDDRLLPAESIRFFQLDQAWVDCLLDGAFSIGRVTGKLKSVDEQQKHVLLQTLPVHPAVTGFLMRSSVVAGWPGLVVDAYGPGDGRGPQLDVHRIDRLGTGVLLCLFSGAAARVEVHLKPEMLHFGIGDRTGDWEAANGVVNVKAFAKSLQSAPPLTSAGLAAKVMAGVPRVSFSLAAE